MAPSDEERIRKFGEASSTTIPLAVGITEDGRSDQLLSFARRLGELAERVRIRTETDPHSALPFLEVGSRIRYHAVPVGPGLEIFLDSLLPDTAPKPPARLKDKLDSIALPVELSLFIAPGCRYCPTMVRGILPLVHGCEFLRLTITDASLFPEAAESSNIRSVPTLLMNSSMRWTGAVEPDQLVEMIVTRDWSHLPASSLEDMIVRGDAASLSSGMLERNRILQAFPEVLVHETFTVRLGAMSVLEELVEKNPALASEVAEPLWDRYENASETVKGDILYLLGELHAQDLAPRIRGILQGETNAEIREAALEALEKL